MTKKKKDKKGFYMSLLDFEDNENVVYSHTWADDKNMFIEINGITSLAIPVDSVLAWIQYLESSAELYFEELDKHETH